MGRSDKSTAIPVIPSAMCLLRDRVPTPRAREQSGLTVKLTVFVMLT